jgi:hypothetical protein
MTLELLWSSWWQGAWITCTPVRRLLVARYMEKADEMLQPTAQQAGA